MPNLTRLRESVGSGRSGDPSRLRLRQQRGGDGVARVGLYRRRHPQQLRDVVDVVIARGREQPHYGGRAGGERAGLVQHHGVYLRRRLRGQRVRVRAKARIRVRVWVTVIHAARNAASNIISARLAPLATG